MDDDQYGRRCRVRESEDGGPRLLTYTSEPLAEEVEITGQPVVALHITSTHTDGAFFLYLEDVAPDGNLRYAVGTRGGEDLWENLTPIERTGYLTDILTDRANLCPFVLAHASRTTGRSSGGRPRTRRPDMAGGST